jgi:rod shape-determining protein MreC
VNSFFKRYREPILVGALLILPLARFLSSGHKGREPDLVDRALLAASSPLQNATTSVLEGVRDGFSGYVALRGAHDEAAQCRAELSVARAELNTLKEAGLENERLKKLLGYADATGPQEVHARVVGLNPSPQFLSVRLNKGESDGVKRGMPVVTPDGVVGQVARASGSYSDVMLLTDPSSRVGIAVQRSRVRGTVTGLGPDRAMGLDNVLRADDVQDGDIVVTSGTDGIFPAGLVVGRVRGLVRHETAMFLQAQIDPSVDLRRFEEVLVVPTLPGLFPSAIGPGKVLP